MNEYKSTVTFNFIKGIIAMAFTGLLGNILYFFIFRNTNGEDPEAAAFRTAIFSFFVFLFSIYAVYEISVVPTKNKKVINEKQSIKDAFRDSGYDLDYKTYFKKMVKTRLWGYYLSVAVWQIPLVINFAIAEAVGKSVYEIPIWLYEWNMQSMFAYELLGDFWFLGMPLTLLLFIPAFNYLMYQDYEQYLVKPSYL